MRMMKTIYQVSALLLVAMMLQACASKQVAVEPVTMKEKPIPMILDTDFGSSTDDLFALMMHLGSSKHQ